MDNVSADMLTELAWWNNERGIDLRGWIACEGNFRLAVGYSSVFWPRFVLIEDYILPEGCSAESIQAWERVTNGNKRAVEATLNHLHIADIQFHGCEDLTEPRVVFLGRILKEIYEAKLAYRFPDRPCEVVFIEPEDRQDLVGFQITFWQRKHAEPSSPTDLASV